jgi:two-component system CheB/CheR fusion protein
MTISDPSAPSERSIPPTPVPGDDEHAFKSREDLAEEAAEQSPLQANHDLFPVVALGASAGGLEAFERFFKHVPAETGMAFIVIQHLDPSHNSMLAELISRYTSMTVQQITDGMPIKRNQVYVIPPNRELSIVEKHLHLVTPSVPRGFRLPIDAFFRALAIDQGKHAIAIVLSGTGSDGSSGLRTIKEYDGMVIAQAPESAKYTGMPTSAIATHAVDFVLTPEAMPQAITDYYAKAIADENTPTDKQGISEQPPELLQEIYALLRTQTGHDFSQYKLNTVARRIERRMIVNHFDHPRGYIDYLQRNRLEIEQLFKELLIGVTNFFRDRESFAALNEQVIPRLFENMHDNTIRVWVPGCSTGEEAYSIAMLLQEYMEQHRRHAEIQIFATDIDDESIAKARSAIYTENIVSDVPPEFLQKYFTSENGRYTVNKDIRSMVVVANQSLIKDPPFSRIDLISCRNLLIYLNAELQKPVIRMFHYALNPSGYLFLGTSETLTGFNHMFEPVDKKARIFRCVKGLVPQTLDFRYSFADSLARDGAPKSTERQLNIRMVTEKTLLDRYAHPSVIIDERGDILYFHGDTDLYLRPASGEASLNILRMARPEVRPVIAAHVRRVVAQRQPIVEENVRITLHDKVQLLRIIFQPIEQTLTLQNLILVIFERVAETTIIPTAAAAEDAPVEVEVPNQRIATLEYDLRLTRDYLQTTVEDLETSNEELTAANEELQSSNEELQSTNEELETTKEELQSINEELITVNAELSQKIDALYKANNDQVNMLNSMHVGLIILDDRLIIRLFNPIAARLLNLMDKDSGRPIQHFAQNFDHHNLAEECERVLDTLKPFSDEVLTNDRRWFLLQIRPYRTLDDIVAGVVITFAEITEQKQMQRQIAQREYLYRTLARHLPEVIVYLFDHDKRFVIVEGQGLQSVGYSTRDAEGKTLEEVSQVPENLETLTKLYGETLQGHAIQLELQRRELTFELATTPIYDEEGRVEYGLLVARDITRRKRIADELAKREQTYQALIDTLPGMALMVFDHELRYLIAGGDALEKAGYQPSAMLGKTLYDILPAERIGDVLEYYQEALAGRRSSYVSTYGGSTYQVVAMPIFNAEGEVQNGMIISYVTEGSG